MIKTFEVWEKVKMVGFGEWEYELYKITTYNGKIIDKIKVR